MEGNYLTPKEVYPMIPKRMMLMFITMVSTGLLILMVERFIALWSRVQGHEGLLPPGNRPEGTSPRRSGPCLPGVDWIGCVPNFRSWNRSRHQFPWPFHFRGQRSVFRSGSESGPPRAP